LPALAYRPCAPYPCHSRIRVSIAQRLTVLPRKAYVCAGGTKEFEAWIVSGGAAQEVTAQATFSTSNGSMNGNTLTASDTPSASEDADWVKARVGVHQVRQQAERLLQPLNGQFAQFLLEQGVWHGAVLSLAARCPTPGPLAPPGGERGTVSFCFLCHRRTESGFLFPQTPRRQRAIRPTAACAQ